MIVRTVIHKDETKIPRGCINILILKMLMMMLMRRSYLGRRLSCHPPSETSRRGKKRQRRLL